MPLRYPMPAMQVADYLRQMQAARSQAGAAQRGWSNYAQQARSAGADAQRGWSNYAQAAARAQPPRYFGGPIGGYGVAPDPQRRYQMMMAARQAAQPRGGYMGGGYGGGGGYGNPGFYRGGSSGGY